MSKTTYFLVMVSLAIMALTLLGILALVLAQQIPGWFWVILFR